jgi:hypothetical protein
MNSDDELPCSSACPQKIEQPLRPAAQAGGGTEPKALASSVREAMKQIAPEEPLRPRFHKYGRGFSGDVPTNQAAVDAWADAQMHARQDPDSYWKQYEQYRHRWPRYVFLAIVAAGEAGIFFFVREIWKRRPPGTILETSAAKADFSVGFTAGLKA